MNIPFVDLHTQYRALEDEIRARIGRVLEHGRYIMGPEVAELEAALARYIGGGRECVTCASGTEALLISMMALGIGPGDEVITTPFTFVATVETIVLLGATPVFVDVRGEDANLDERLLPAAITQQTKAIMPVSLYGQPCDMDGIEEAAAGIAVIEDAAQSFGAVYKGRRSGALSRVGCTSFFPSKPLGCYGDGGAIFTDDAELAQAMREIRVHGQSKRYVHTRIGVGGRMDTMQCAVVLAKLTRFEREIEARARIAARYADAFADLAPGLELIRVTNDRSSVWAQFTVKVADRAPFVAALEAAGVPTAIHYPVPLNAQPAYRGYGAPEDTPISARLAQEVVSLPMSADLDPAHQDHIIATVRRAIGR